MPEPAAWLPQRPVRARGEETVRRILAAGRSCFRTHGYSGARIDDIVERAGTSHGAFYLYFRNKEDLLHRLAVDCGARLRVLADDLDGLPRPLEVGALRDWVRRFVAAYHEDGPVITVWLDNRDSDPLMQALANESLGPLAEALSSIVDPALAGEVDHRLAGLGLLSLLERLSSYLRDVPEDLAATTAAQLMYAASLGSDPDGTLTRPSSITSAAEARTCSP